MLRLCFILVAHITSHEETEYAYAERLKLCLEMEDHFFFSSSKLKITLESNEPMFFPCILRMLIREHRWI